ncbi:MAG: methionine--tRNA ligase [Candidatus ainarchaeum sp.]|nr:methionine--tRNA ligase [Candidatus ainarchaeum sp.]
MKRLITSALPYVNNKPHLGNLVGSVLPADIFSRFSRNQGKKVLFVCGSDEYGTPITVTAKKMGKTPKEVCDIFHDEHRRLYDWFNIGFDVFSRTTSENHQKITQDIFMEIYKNNFTTEKTEEAFYCEKDKMYLPDRYVEGKCPECGGLARGDQCDCGYVLKTPIELKEPYCVFCKSKPVVKETKHIYLDYSKLEMPLIKWVNSKEKDWNPLTVSIARAWLEKGLKARSITRDLDWGIKVPLPGYEDKVFYVWFDAPIGYISFVNDAVGNITDWWGKKSDAKIFHFLGKDNIPFHTIFWPSTLLASGKYKLPDNVVGLSYLNFGGQKVSKSLGHGIFCEDAVKSGLPADVWRFYLANILPLGGDTDWSDDDFLQFTNSTLVGNISNLYYRVLTFAQKNLELLPRPTLEVIDKDYLTKRSELISKYEREMDAVKLKEGFKTAIEFASLANKYFQEKAPWQEKDNTTTIYVSVNLCLDLALLLEPFIPDFSQKLFNLLGVERPYLINYLDINYFIAKPGFPITKEKIPMFFTRMEPLPARAVPKPEKKVEPKKAEVKKEPKQEVKKETKVETKPKVKSPQNKAKVKTAVKKLKAKAVKKKVIPKKKVKAVAKPKKVVKKVLKKKVIAKPKVKAKAKVKKVVKKAPKKVVKTIVPKKKSFLKSLKKLVKKAKPIQKKKK